MATRVELPIEQVKTALNVALQSAKRGSNTAKNSAFKMLFEKDVSAYTLALASLTEITNKIK